MKNERNFLDWNFREKWDRRNEKYMKIFENCLKVFQRSDETVLG